MSRGDRPKLALMIFGSPSTSASAMSGLVARRASADGQRWFAVATMSHDGCDQRSLERLTNEIGEDAALIIGFVAPHQGGTDRVAAIARGARSVPLIGCSTSGVVDSSSRFDAAVQLVAFGGPGFSANVSSSDYRTDGCRASGRAVAAAAGHEVELENRALILLCDGLLGDVADVVRGAYNSAGATVSIVGGCAGDDLAMQQTAQFCGEEILTGGVVAASLASSAPIGIGVQHGWTAVGEPMVVTETEGTSLISLDDRPAMDMYLEAVGEDAAPVGSAEFARFAQIHPLGLTEHSAEHVRFVTGGDLDRRSLEFLVHIPEGQLVWVMRGDRDSVVRATHAAVDQAVQHLAGRPPIGVVAFDCVARRSVIGDHLVADETRALDSALPSGTPFGGFYTYGEIARTGGALGLHHQTMVIMAVA